MTDLLTTLDQAAQRLLANAGLDDVADFSTPSSVDLAEKVKAFQAVAAWADKRRELVAAREPPKESQFEALKRKMHEEHK